MAENSSDRELTTRQQRAIAALLTERNIGAAATRAKVGERTLYTWLGDPQFRAAVRSAEGAAIDSATRRLVGLADSAIDILSSTLTDAEAAPATKLRAAQTVLDQLLRLRELATLEERVAALERDLGSDAEGA